MSDNSQDDPMSSTPATLTLSSTDDPVQSDVSRVSFILRQGSLQRMYNEYRQIRDRVPPQPNSHPAESQNHQVDDIMVQALRKEVNDLYHQIKGLLELVVEEREYHPSEPLIVQVKKCFEKMKQLKSSIDQHLEEIGNFLKEMDKLRQGWEEQVKQYKIKLAASEENEMESLSNLKKVQEEAKELSLKLKQSNKMLARHKVKVSRQIEITNEINNVISDILLHHAMPTIMLSQRPKDVTDKVSVLVLGYKKIIEEVNKTKLELEQAKEGANELSLKLLESNKKLKEAESLITRQEERLSRQIEINSLIKNSMSAIILPQKPNNFTDKFNMLFGDYNGIKDAISRIKFPREVISQDLSIKVKWLASDYEKKCEKQQGKEAKELLLKLQVSDNMPKDAKSSITSHSISYKVSDNNMPKDAKSLITSDSISYRILHRDWVINKIKDTVSNIKFPREVISKDLATKVRWLARDYKAKDLLLKLQVSDNKPKDAKSSVTSHIISHRILHRDWVINKIKNSISDIKFSWEVVYILSSLGKSYPRIFLVPSKVRWLARNYKRTCDNIKLEHSLDDIEDTEFPHEEAKEPIESLDKVKWLVDFYQKK